MLGKLESCNDLVAAVAICHRNCMTKFRLARSTKRKRGKAVDVKLLEGFESVSLLEKERNCDFQTIKELQKRMKEKSNGEVYLSVWSI